MSIERESNLLALNDKSLMVIRVLTAFVIGYGLATLYSIAISKILMLFGVTNVNATVSMQLLAFLIYAIVAMWVFSVSSLKKLWIHIVYSILISVGIIYIINWRLGS